MQNTSPNFSKNNDLSRTLLVLTFLSLVLFTQTTTSSFVTGLHFSTRVIYLAKYPENLTFPTSIADAGKLPWKCGTQMVVTQGREHPYWQDHWAWDFANQIQPNWPIYAARDGIVAIVETSYETNSGCGTCDPNKANRIIVDHGDGTSGIYMHLAREYPPRLEVNDPVYAGVTVIGEADTTGWTYGPHLHYAVQSWNSVWNGQPGRWYQPSIESLFSDPNVLSDGGNPITGKSYPSGNCSTMPIIHQLTVELRSNVWSMMAANRVVSYTLTTLDGDFVHADTTITDENGVFHISTNSNPYPISEGHYNLAIKLHGWIEKEIHNINLIDGLYISAAPFDSCGCGDVNGDNNVDLIDFNIWRAEYIGERGTRDADFNGNEVVDLLDFNMWRVGYFKPSSNVLTGEINPTFQNNAIDELLPGELSLALMNTSDNSNQLTTTPNFQVGDVFTLTLGFDTGGLLMTSVDTMIDYDHCVVELLNDRIVNNNLFELSAFRSLSVGLLNYGGYQFGETPPISGAGDMLYIPFRVIAGSPDPSMVAIRYYNSATTDSNMVERTTIQDLLGQVTNFDLLVTGTPQRPTRTAQITNPINGGVINQNAVILEALANDPCGGIKQIVFYVFYDNLWHEIGADVDGTDGWSLYWDASQVSDQNIAIKAYASDMAGNGVYTSITFSDLDRTPPEIVSLTFDPLTAQLGETVSINLLVADNFTGIKKMEIYVDPSSDGSTSWGSWDLLGTVIGNQYGTFIWDTTNYSPGGHQLTIIMEDMAGNQTLSPWPGSSPLVYWLHLYCQQPSLLIPDNNPTGVTDNMTIINNDLLADMNVYINVAHSWVGDLMFTLTHQDTGTSVVFFDRPGVPASQFGCFGSHINATLDDEARLPVEDECDTNNIPVINGSFIPNNPLSVFDDEEILGTWILTAADLVSGDIGVVEKWCLTPITSQKVYLPYLSGPLSTVPPTPTPTPPPVNVLQNGNFEQGQVAWQEYSTHGWQLILPANELPVPPQSGSWGVWLGGDFQEISYVSQQVTVPAGNSNLVFWHWIVSEDICGYDFGGVVVNGNAVMDVFDLCTNTNTGGWVSRSVNLAAYAGQTIQIEIRSETDSSLHSNLFVDNVSLGGLLVGQAWLVPAGAIQPKSSFLGEAAGLPPAVTEPRLWPSIGSGK